MSKESDIGERCAGQPFGVYVLQFEVGVCRRGWVLRTEEGSLVQILQNSWAKDLSIRDAAYIMEQFTTYGQPCELKIRNKNGTYGPARTYPRSSDPRKSKG